MEKQPEVVEEIKSNLKNYKAIIDGMRRVSETGTAASTFVNYDIPVGGKTAPHRCQTEKQTACL
jgi:cell division protein FtsI/penicillin-binding protein 2